MCEEALTSRAQARVADDVLRDSGTATAIPRCLQRFVRFHGAASAYMSTLPPLNLLFAASPETAAATSRTRTACFVPRTGMTRSSGKV